MAQLLQYKDQNSKCIIKTNVKRKEDAMKTIIGIIAVLGTTTSLALAGESAEATGTSLLVFLFLGFGALIIVCQLIPGVLLFCSMLKGLFAKSFKESMPVADDGIGETV
jgi:hypothetical protein